MPTRSVIPMADPLLSSECALCSFFTSRFGHADDDDCKYVCMHTLMVMAVCGHVGAICDHVLTCQLAQQIFEFNWLYRSLHHAPDVSILHHMGMRHGSGLRFSIHMVSYVQLMILCAFSSLHVHPHLPRLSVVPSAHIHLPACPHCFIYL